jgi:hypothetical protein
MTSPDRLPVPPLRLRRVRLHGVGPDGARFDPLDLDFATASGAASRVLLSLTNTGGKSTLITLISSLVVPASRSQVGGKNLGDYILTGDTGHVVCEWEDTSTGVSTITGTVMEWKDGRRQPPHRQRSTTNMHRAWYLFRTGPHLPAIDDLPFVVGDHRATFTTYLDKLTDLLGQHPATGWVLTRTQQEWTQSLENNTSVDPVLFGYQMRMNDSEAGAERLLEEFDSPDNVVRFFISALNDDRDIADFTSKLGNYADLAVKRPLLQALSDFCLKIGPTIEQIADKASAADKATADALRVQTQGRELAGAAHARLTQDRSLLVETEQEVRSAAANTATARREYGQISDIRQQLLLEEARARAAAAAAEVQRRTDAAEIARQEDLAWQAVNAVLDVQIAVVNRDSAQQAYDRADAGLGPLRARVDSATADLAARLEGLAREANTVADTADARAEEARGQEQKAIRAEKDAAARRTAARRRLEEIDEYARQAQNATQAAVAAGWLTAGESAEQCLRRWQDARGAANVRNEEESRRATEAEQARAATDTQLNIVDTELIKLRAIAQDDQSRLDQFTSEFASVAAHPTVHNLLGGPAHTTPEIERAQSLANDAARGADRRAAEHERLANAAREELAHLDQTGTASAGADVLAIVEALRVQRIGAVSGLEWIEHNIADPDARPGFITNNPDIAGGVIVSDPARLTAAVEYLREVNPRTRTPVTVTGAPASGEFDTTDSARFVVLPHRATFDRKWAQTVRAEYEKTAADDGAAAAQARNDATSYRDAAAACASFIDRWPNTRREDLESHTEHSAAAVAATQDHRDELLEERDRHRDSADEARRRAESARQQAGRADKQVTLVRELIGKTDAASSAITERPSIEAGRVRAERDESAAQAAQYEAEATRTANLNAAVEARTQGSTCLRERAELGVENAGPDPGGNLDVIRSSANVLRNELDAAERGMTEAGQLDSAKIQLSRAISRRDDRYESHIVQHAEELTLLPAASSTVSLSGAQRRAHDSAAAREKERVAAEHDLTVAEKEVRAAQPTAGDRQNHVDLTNVPDWLPSTPDEIPSLLERLETRNVELLERRDAAASAEQDAIDLRDELKADVDAFIDVVEMWAGDPAPGVPAFSGRKDAARTQMRALVKAQNDATNDERTARDNLSETVNTARAEANNARWHELDAPVVVRIRELQEGQLVAEAETLGRRIRAMAESASGDLATMDTHRSILRDGLLSLCREQRRLLREVSMSSRLPSGLGDLTGQPAIKIRFEDAPDDEARARLADRIDTWAAELAVNLKRASSADVRARWLADAVRDTVLDRSRAGAWSIEILKPRIDGQVIYCPPDRIPHEFSGGQVLTLAVLVYCALSRVRSAHRTGGARPPGTLLLDNPFGAASAETLIEMQHRLAAHTGLQLVCATGLNDANVDAAFAGPGSVIVKLRNDGDLRRNLSFLRLRSRTVDGVDIAASITAGRPAAAQQNWVDSTRYEIRG